MAVAVAVEVVVCRRRLEDLTIQVFVVDGKLRLESVTPICSQLPTSGYPECYPESAILGIMIPLMGLTCLRKKWHFSTLPH